MKLIIFDIDGTILDSVNHDDKCFIQTFRDLYQIELGNVDWNNFKNVTDTGLTEEIFESYFHRLPKKVEIERIKEHFYNLLESKINEVTEIENALSFIKQLSLNSELLIGFATGGWKETAELKCESVGLDLANFFFKSSNDHFNRGEIIKLVVENASNKNNRFESIFYFGDGQWDLKTSNELGINFIGVDSNKNNVLYDLGVDKIINNYNDPDRILSWIMR